ncbi:MAG: bifunctional metallophosphatase/5'-nucleotidase [Deltaproteobacteria bacterium]|nr:bifunctional metallophosphatase/5'-nucleotidase [Deltaproteobacteria bacterium]
MKKLCSAVLTALVVSACYEEGPTIDLGDRDVALTILHTSDIHSRILPYTYDPPAPIEENGLTKENAPFGGIAKLATLIKRERARAKRVIYVDSGDIFQGAPIFNYFKGEPEVRAMSELKLDAFALGNHDFDLGVDNAVLQYGTWANFPVMAANWSTDRADVLGNKQLGSIISPLVVLDVKGLRVLIIGLGNRSSMTSLGEGGNSMGVTPYDPHPLVQQYINQWAPYVDLVVGVSHLGLDEDIRLITGTYRYLRESELSSSPGCGPSSEPGVLRCRVPGVRGLDLLFGGHHHIVLNPPKVLPDPDGRSVPLVHTGAFLQFLGRLDVITRPAKYAEPPRPDWYGREVIDHKYTLFPIDRRTRDDPRMQRRLAPYVQELALNTNLGKPVAFAPESLLRRSPSGTDSVLGNIVAEAIRTRAGVETDFAMTNSLGIRDNIYPGVITSETLFNVFPFENTIATMFVSGAEVQEIFDFVAGRSTARGCQSQVQVAGVSFTMRCDCAINNDGCCAAATRYQGEYPKACAENIRIRGVPINPNGTYELGSNDYIAGGGSGFIMLRRNTTQRNTGIPLRTAVEEWMQQQPPCTASYELACSDEVPDSSACQYKRVLENFGAPACVLPDGIIDGRIERRVGQ